ncbi:MAG TPA: hypothetical protein VN408_29100, partial [Actinoplanes sp.]|nr:hypothetical protein [Actinoplanes sp.]
TLAASVLFGLMFFEKSLLAVALVFLTTLCLYTRGNPVRSLLTTIRQWWPSWLTLTVVSSAFLVFYLARSTSSLRRPSSAGEVVRFVTQMFTDTLVPGLLGGPWLWWPAGDGAPITAPTAIARWTALGVMVLFIAFTVWLRGSEAFRAWLLVLLYTALVVGLLGATRMGSVYSGVAGAVPRYISDVVVVAAVAIGAALCGLNREGAEPVPERKRAALLSGRFAVPALAAVVALLAASTAVTTWRFGDEWAIKRGRDYLATARADLAEAPAGTVFMDQPVPEEVVGRLSGPYNSQSEFFAPLKGDGPVFVIEARQLSIFDDAGHVRRARVDGVSAPPGPRQGCGYRVTGTKPVRIPLASSVVEYYHVVRIAYLSNQDSGATLRLGAGQAVAIDVHKGLNEMFVLVWGGGNTIELKLLDGTTGVCTDEVTVGQPVPASAG